MPRSLISCRRSPPPPSPPPLPPGARVLVAGAGGHLGRHVVRAFRDRGWRVRALTRRAGAKLLLIEDLVCGPNVPCRAKLGDVLSDASRAQLNEWMESAVTGDAKLRAGVPEGWTFKDGTEFCVGLEHWHGSHNDNSFDLEFVPEEISHGQNTFVMEISTNGRMTKNYISLAFINGASR